mgnify:CR=1 FL=1
MSAIHTLNGRNVSVARVPSLKSILGEKPVCPADAYAFNAVKDALAGNYQSKDVARVCAALIVAKKALGIFLDLANDAELLDAKSAERLCYETAGTLSFAHVTESAGIVAFLIRFFDCAELGVLVRFCRGQNINQVREALATARGALGQYIDLSEAVSLSLMKQEKALRWCQSTAKALPNPLILEALPVIESFIDFFDKNGEAKAVAESPARDETPSSLFAAPITKTEAVTALRESVPPITQKRALSLIRDLKFAVECMSNRHAARSETLLFRHELTEAQLQQAIALLEAVSDVISANAKEE